jgi:hypothetical protein
MSGLLNQSSESDLSQHPIPHHPPINVYRRPPPPQRSLQNTQTDPNPHSDSDDSDEGTPRCIGAVEGSEDGGGFRPNKDLSLEMLTGMTKTCSGLFENIKCRKGERYVRGDGGVERFNAYNSDFKVLLGVRRKDDGGGGEMSKV